MQNPEPKGPKRPGRSFSWLSTVLIVAVFAVVGHLVSKEFSAESAFVDDAASTAPLAGSSGGDAEEKPIEEVTGLPWCKVTNDDFAACMQQARSSGKRILVYTGASWCGPCRALRARTFADPRVRARLSKLFLVYVDGPENRKTVREFGVDSYPTNIFFDGDGKTVKVRLVGFYPPPEFLKELDDAGM